VHDILLNVFVDNCVHQMVSLPTRQNNILHIFLTNGPQFIFDRVLKDSLGGSDHQSVLLQLCIPHTSTAHTLVKAVDIMHTFIVWDSASIDRAREYLYTYNWNHLFNVNSSPEEVWSHFFYSFERLYLMHSPYNPYKKTQTESTSQSNSKAPFYT